MYPSNSNAQTKPPQYFEYKAIILIKQQRMIKNNSATTIMTILFIRILIQTSNIYYLIFDSMIHYDSFYESLINVIAKF